MLARWVIHSYIYRLVMHVFSSEYMYQARTLCVMHSKSQLWQLIFLIALRVVLCCITLSMSQRWNCYVHIHMYIYDETKLVVTSFQDLMNNTTFFHVYIHVVRMTNTCTCT